MSAYLITFIKFIFWIIKLTKYDSNYFTIFMTVGSKIIKLAKFETDKLFYNFHDLKFKDQETNKV